MPGGEAAKKKKSQPTATTTSTFSPLSFLSDDDLSEIFLRVLYPSTLLRCALTNKRHLRLISDPTFLRRFRELHPGPGPLLGWFFRRDLPPLDRHFGLVHPGPPSRLDFFSHLFHRSSPEPLPHFVPIKHVDRELAAVSRAVRFRLPGEEGGGGGRNTTWDLADCANGLLLLRSKQRQQLAVIDPLAPRRQFLLPFPPAASLGPQLNCYLIVHEGGGDDHASLFQVLCLLEKRDLVHGSDEVEFCVFSPSNGEWRSVPLNNKNLFDVAHPKYELGVVMRAKGNLYWLRGDWEGMLMLDTVKLLCSYVKLPELKGSTWVVGETENREVCIGEIRDDHTMLYIFVLKNEEEGVWGFEKEVELKKLVSEKCGRESEVLKIKSIMAGSVLFYMSDRKSGSSFYSLHLKTEQLEEVLPTDIGGDMYPYTMAWPPSFLKI